MDFTGPTRSARTASATALRYCGTANFAGSPRPTTSTRGADTPVTSGSSAVRPVLPETSPRSSSAVRRPPEAASIACADGDNDLSAYAPTTTQSVSAVRGSGRFRTNSRAIDGFSVQLVGWRDGTPRRRSPTVYQAGPATEGSPKRML